jgi:HAE1 family hydrophobic/amphiphilic exporter-1
MATSVALPLEKQFQTMPGLQTISSTSTLGNTSLTLEFEEGRNIDAAAVDVQAALLRAQRALPDDMTNAAVVPQGQPGRCAGAVISLRSPSMPRSDLQDYAEHLISPTLSTISGVAQVNIFGQALCGAGAGAARRAGRTQHGRWTSCAALRAANVNTPVGTLKARARRWCCRPTSSSKVRPSLPS